MHVYIRMSWSTADLIFNKMRRPPRSLTRRGDDGPFRLPLQVVCALEQRQFRLQRLVLLHQILDRDHGLILQIDHALNDWRKCEGYAECFFPTPMPKPPGCHKTPTHPLCTKLLVVQRGCSRIDLLRRRSSRLELRASPLSAIIINIFHGLGTSCMVPCNCYSLPTLTQYPLFPNFIFDFF